MKTSLASGVRILVAAAAVAFLVSAQACGGDDGGGGNGECANVAGSWDISGDCGQDFCVITQTGCSTNFDCGGASSYTGTVSGNDVDYDGQAADGTPGTCSGTVSGDTITGTCTIMGFTCGFHADRQ
jgi:hypothetical protein